MRAGLGREDIRALLDDLSGELAARGARAELFLVGGAALAVAYDATRATRDLDAVFIPTDVVRQCHARRSVTLLTGSGHAGSSGRRRSHVGAVVAADGTVIAENEPPERVTRPLASWLGCNMSSVQAITAQVVHAAADVDSPYALRRPRKANLYKF